MTDRVVIVGAGPTGLTLALELGRFGVASTIVDAKPSPSEEGSRAIVIARHALEVWDRHGCAAPMVEKGVTLTRARTYWRETELFSREFPPPEQGQIPPFMNLQQVFTEKVLFDAVGASPHVELRWNARVVGLEQDAEVVTVDLAGGEQLRTRFAIGCDGVSSIVRETLGIAFPGKAHPDRFLICDIRASLPFPAERRFFFDPPFNPGRTCLIHPQPDDEWRIDWQVPEATDAGEELRSGRLHERVTKIIGDTPYEVAWLTAYRFHQRVADRWRAGRVFLAGDAAHRFSPFGARGMNSGVEDASNLAWKLAAALRREAGDALLDTYESERRPAALVNLRVTADTMRFMAPPTALHRLVRDAILRGSSRFVFLRARVNSGRLAEPAVYGGTAPLGRPVPRTAPCNSIGDGLGFSAASIGGSRYLVRPDGYVCDRLDGDVSARIRRALSGESAW